MLLLPASSCGVNFGVPGAGLAPPSPITSSTAGQLGVTRVPLAPSRAGRDRMWSFLSVVIKQKDKHVRSHCICTTQLSFINHSQKSIHRSLHACCNETLSHPVPLGFSNISLPPFPASFCLLQSAYFRIKHYKVQC